MSHRHLMARVRRRAAHDWAEPVPHDTRNGINGRFDRPHGWQQHPPLDEDEFFDEGHPYHREGGEDEWHRIPESFKQTPEFAWHPHWGETHVRYDVLPVFGNDWENPPTAWRVIHRGGHLGQATPSGDFGDHPVWYSANLPDEERERRGTPGGVPGGESSPFGNGEFLSPKGGGRFRTPEEARDAAEAHFAEHYGQGRNPYLLDQPPPDSPPTDPDDFDYGDIFGDRS